MRAGTTRFGRVTRLAVAGVLSTAVAVGGVSAAGAVDRSPAPATVAPVAVAPAAVAPAAAAVTATDAQVRASGQYEFRYNIKVTARYNKTVFSEITNEGKFNQIFPTAGAKANLGRVGTRHVLRKGPILFPVQVTRLTTISWIFKTLPGHPEHPGHIEFQIAGGGGSMLRLIVVGNCPLCGTATHQKIAKAEWQRFANNIRNKIRLP